MAPRNKKEEKEKCDVMGCEEEAKRSIPLKKAKRGLPKEEFSESGRRVHLCKEHYKQFKKATKKDRELERLGWE